MFDQTVKIPVPALITAGVLVGIQYYFTKKEAAFYKDLHGKYEQMHKDRTELLFSYNEIVRKMQ